jgi:riboflavin biosynthesis pyrimidine reductase
MRRLLPSAEDDVDLELAYALPPGTSWLRANMVSTIDGSVTGENYRSGSISGTTDKAVFAALRTLADAVLVGAGTARTEGYRPSTLPIVLVSNRLALDLSLPLFTESEHRTIVIAPSSAPADLMAATAEVADVITAGHATVDLRVGVDALRARGLDHVLCEGGPSLLGSLLAADLVDEICAVTSPRVVGGGAGRIVHGAWLTGDPWRLAHLFEDDGFLFARWQRR